MVPAPNRTPQLIASSSEQRPGSCRGRAKPVPAKGRGSWALTLSRAGERGWRLLHDARIPVSSQL